MSIFFLIGRILFSAVFLSIIALIPGAHWIARRFVAHGDSSAMKVVETTVTASSISYALAASAGDDL